MSRPRNRTPLPFGATLPRYVHYAERSCWLGQHAQYDLYLDASEAGGLQLVARYGHGDSGLATYALRRAYARSELVEPFRTAYVRALERGLVP